MAANQPLTSTTPGANIPSTNTNGPETYWKLWHTLAIPVLLIVTGLVGLLFPPSVRLLTWIAILFLLLLLALTIGLGTTNTWNGLLVDERNKISLARFQMLLWTLIILSTFLCIALVNIRIASPLTALAINIPTELWVLMGISTTSLVGSPIALSVKGDQVTTNANRSQARFSDMFMGEESANQGRLDLGKVQLFYFTIILAVAYISALVTLFVQSSTLITAFPTLNDGIVTLLGVSHAGYLINKTVPRVGNTNAANENQSEDLLVTPPAHPSELF